MKANGDGPLSLNIDVGYPIYLTYAVCPILGLHTDLKVICVGIVIRGKKTGCGGGRVLQRQFFAGIGFSKIKFTGIYEKRIKIKRK